MMPWLEIVSYLLIGAVAAAIAQFFAGFSLVGFLATLVAAFAGAWGAVWLVGAIGLPTIVLITINGEALPLVWAAIGALVLALIISLVLQRMLLRTLGDVID